MPPEIRSHTKNTVSCWLLNSKVDPVVEQVRTYADEPSSVYEWDSLVPNYSKPKAGDFILIWDSGQLLVFGMSVIQTISSEETFKVLLRCPECMKTDVRPREKLVPRYRCGKCRTEFAEPVREEVRITRFKSDHEAGWQDLSGLLDGSDLKKVCFEPESQHSIREIDLDKFEELMSSKSLSFKTESVRDLQREIAGGYKWTRAKTRIGQDLFRKELLDKYGATCAIVGVSHPKTIQACHLYSWSEKGKHDIDGGLLMRSDLHSLFDDGLLRINPDSLKVVLSEELAEYPDYWQFNDQALKVDLSNGQKEWLQIRWEQHP